MDADLKGCARLCFCILLSARRLLPAASSCRGSYQAEDLDRRPKRLRQPAAALAITSLTGLGEPSKDMGKSYYFSLDK